jgi:hypothetical protein
MHADVLPRRQPIKRSTKLASKKGLRDMNAAWRNSS